MRFPQKGKVKQRAERLRIPQDVGPLGGSRQRSVRCRPLELIGKLSSSKASSAPSRIWHAVSPILLTGHAHFFNRSSSRSRCCARRAKDPIDPCPHKLILGDRVAPVLGL